jgi:hypothetical protein
VGFLKLLKASILCELNLVYHMLTWQQESRVPLVEFELPANKIMSKTYCSLSPTNTSTNVPRHPIPAGVADRQELLPEQVGQGRLSRVSAILCIALLTDRVRCAQAGSSLCGEGLRLLDTAEDRHLAWCRAGQRQEDGGEKRVWTSASADQAADTKEAFLSGERGRSMKHIGGVWELSKMYQDPTMFDNDAWTSCYSVLGRC